MAKFESYALTTTLNDADITLFNRDTVTHRISFLSLVNLYKNRLGLDDIDDIPTNESTNLVKSGGVYSALSEKANSNDLSTVATSGSYDDLLNKPTIDDALSNSSTNAVQNSVIYTALSGKADSATTLSGYGITNAYTKTETDNLLNDKADLATTLNGYGITDAYTKTETDNAINTKLSSVYKYKGSVNTYADLPTEDMEVGDTYNIVTADTEHDIHAGDNVSWNGTAWDKLAGTVDLSNYYTITQVDTLLSAKANTNSLATVATSGSYNDLSDQPTIDTTLSSTSTNALQNKAIYTALGEKANTSSLATVATSGLYSDLSGTPTIDSALSSTSTNAVQNKAVYTALSDKVDSSSLATVATSGSYNDLSDKPTIDTTLSSTSTNAVQNKAVYTALSYKANTSSLANVATSGSYNDLTNKPDLSSYVTDTDYASASTAGVIKIGTNLSIDANGVVSATGGAQITVDSALSTSSTNPVQNAVITTSINSLISSLSWHTET